VKTKNGVIRRMQRWKCVNCGYNYTKSEPRGYPKWMKRRALELYLEGVGLREIGRLLGVANVTVLYWVRGLGEKVLKLRRERGAVRVQVMKLDEMEHYVRKNNKNFGYGSLMIGKEESLPIPGSDIVMIGRKKG